MFYGANNIDQWHHAAAFSAARSRAICLWRRSHIRRRKFLAMLLGAAATWPLPLSAQQIARADEVIE